MSLNYLSFSLGYVQFPSRQFTAVNLPPDIPFVSVSRIVFPRNCQQNKVLEIEESNMVGQVEEDIIENDFIILKSLGCGSFGEVKLACHLPTNTKVAVKLLERNQNAETVISSEAEILQSLEHRNIVRFSHVMDTLKLTYVVMEKIWQ